MGTGHKPGLKRTQRPHGQAMPQGRVTPRDPNKARVTQEEFIACCRDCGGDMKLMAVALDLAYQSVRQRFHDNPDLMLIRNECRQKSWSTVIEQAEDNIKAAIMDGSIDDSWKYLGIKNPKEWAAIERKETTIIHTTAEDLAAFDRADNTDDALIEEKKRSQAVADELAALKLKVAALPKPSNESDVIEAEVINAS